MRRDETARAPEAQGAPRALEARGRVSVLLPVKNGEASIGEAVGSVLADLRHQDELIVIDDGSTDRTFAIVAGTPGRVQVLRNRGTGIVDALNTGLAVAVGDYLARCDADDTWLPGHRDRLVTALEADATAVAAFGGAVLIGPGGEPRGLSVPPTADRLAAVLLRENPLVHGTVLARTTAVRAAGGYHDYPGAEDYDLWLRLTRLGGIVTIPTPVYSYRLSDSGAHRTKRRRQARSSVRILLTHGAATRRWSPYGIVRNAGSAVWPGRRFWYSA